MMNAIKINEERERVDVRAVGLMMIELMEPETSLRDPASLVLKNPEKWLEGWGIRDFLSSTGTARLEELIRVGLIQLQDVCNLHGTRTRTFFLAKPLIAVWFRLFSWLNCPPKEGGRSSIKPESKIPSPITLNQLSITNVDSCHYGKLVQEKG